VFIVFGLPFFEATAAATVSTGQILVWKISQTPQTGFLKNQHRDPYWSIAEFGKGEG
jgi:hypothetical protein